MSHYFLVHSKELNFFVKCGVNDCPATLRRYHSFYKHMAKNRKDEYKGNIAGPGNIHGNIYTHNVIEDLVTNLHGNSEASDFVFN